jgi:hypothetical protein
MNLDDIKARARKHEHRLDDVEDLITEVERLRDEVEWLRADRDALRAKHEGGSGEWWADWHRTHCAAARAADDMKAEVERLRALIVAECDETCAPHLFQFCSPLCEAAGAP